MKNKENGEVFEIIFGAVVSTLATIVLILSSSSDTIRNYRHGNEGSGLRKPARDPRWRMVMCAFLLTVGYAYTPAKIFWRYDIGADFWTNTTLYLFLFAFMAFWICRGVVRLIAKIKHSPIEFSSFFNF